MEKPSSRLPSRNRRKASAKRAPAAQPTATVAIADDRQLVGEALAVVIANVPSLTVSLITVDTKDLVELAKIGAPTLVMIDAGMAQAFWTASWLARHNPATRIVILDEVEQTVHVRRARDSGAAAYLTKDGSLSELVTTISQVLAGEVIFPVERPARSIPRSPGAVSSTVSSHPTPALLTARELEVLALLAAGKRVIDCARLLGVSPNTIDNHKARIMRKLAMHKTVELTRFAMRHGIVKDS